MQNRSGFVAVVLLLFIITGVVGFILVGPWLLGPRGSSPAVALNPTTSARLATATQRALASAAARVAASQTAAAVASQPTPTRTATPTPTSTPEPTQTPTPTPPPTDTPTPEPSPTETPSPTSTPSPRPTLKPTARKPTPTPTLLPPIVLVAPANGQRFADMDTIVLQWRSIGPLAEKAYYVPAVGYHPKAAPGQTWYDDTPWTKQATWTLSEHRYLVDLSADGLFFWSVRVMLQTGVDAQGRPKGIPLSKNSEVWTLTWAKPVQPPPGPTPVPTTPVPPTPIPP